MGCIIETKNTQRETAFVKDGIRDVYLVVHVTHQP